MSMLTRQTKKLVTKHEAVLDIPHERSFAIDATHLDLVNYSSAADPSYLRVVEVLRSIVSRLPKHGSVTQPPVTPGPPAGTVPLESPRRIDFMGYVHLFKQSSLDNEEECLISDMLAKSPTALLNSLNVTYEKAGCDPLVWAHVPVNNTSWVNVRDLPTKRFGMTDS